jgi:hypothetical protein
MKNAAVTALRKARGAFFVMHQHEAEVLDSLPLWYDRLFRLLVKASCFKTGQGDVSYAQLEDKLARVIQPRSGPRHQVPSIRSIEVAVRKLEARQILARDKRHSEAERRLFFAVASRYAEARPSSGSWGQNHGRVDSEKASVHAGCEPMGVGIVGVNSGGSSVVNSLHIGKTELCTGRAQKQTVEVRKMKARVKQKA